MSAQSVGRASTRALLREHLIDFGEWLSAQAETDVMTVDEAVDSYLEREAAHPLSPATYDALTRVTPPT